MSFDINISSNVADAVVSMNNFSEKIMIEATRAAINRGIGTGRKKAAQTLSQRLNIKSSVAKKKVAITKARGGNLRSLEGNISFDDEPQSIINFVKGSKQIIKQKGIKIKRRRKLKVEITKGRRFIMRGAFIQKVKSKQVFRRGDSGGLKKQSAPSIAEFVGRNKFRRPIMKSMRESFNKNFKNQYTFRLEREQQKLAQKKFKKIK